MHGYDFSLEYTLEEIETAVEKYFFDASSWDDIFICQNLSDEFILKHIHRVEPITAIKHQNLSDEVLEKIMYDIRYSDLSAVILKGQNVSEEFIDKHWEFFKNSMIDMCRRIRLSESFIEQRWTHFRNMYSTLAENKLLTEKLARKYLENNSFDGRYMDVFWSTISKHCVLSKEFIDEYQEYLFWNKISCFQPFGSFKHLVDKYRLNIDWSALSGRCCKDIKFDDDFIIQHEDELDIQVLLRRGRLSSKLLDRYASKLGKQVRLYHREYEV